MTALLFPTRCPVCGDRGPAPCAACIGDMHRAPSMPAPAAVDHCLALLSYDGAARELVARLKYRNARASVAWLAGAMAALVDEHIDVVTHIPTTPARRRDRGFDHAELLARDVARRLGRPQRTLLRREAGSPQTGADAATRRTASIGLHATQPLWGTVLAVDDVITTGATATAAGHALRCGGAQRIVVLAAGRTPPPGALH